HLTSHQAGLPANPPLGWGLLVQRDLTPREQRAAALDKLLAQKPVGSPGEKFEYSNIGYVIAAIAAEKCVDKSWEDLMADEVFVPLGMKSAGHGVPGSAKGPPDQPRPHAENGSVRPTLDNPALMGPAGNVHCSMADWAKFIADVLRGARGGNSHLKPA